VIETQGADDKSKKLESDSKNIQSGQQQQTETELKQQTEKIATTTTQRIEDTTMEKKEDITSSSIHDSSEDNKKQKTTVKKMEITEKELSKNILITLSETPTTFMYFLPSQKYFHLRPGKIKHNSY